MSNREIAHRVRDAIAMRIERSRWKSGKSRSSIRLIQPYNRILQQASMLCPGIDDIRIPGAQRVSHFEDQYSVCLLGEKFLLSHPIKWSLDPRKNYQWESQFYGDLNLYNHESGADPKYPWELARHQYLLELAMKDRDSQDQQNGNHAITCLIDWIDTNPLCEGIHWTSSLEPAMRTISWTWLLAALKDSPNWNEDQLQKITQSLIDHGRYLSKHLSYFSSPYNHIIGEATGLLLLSILLDGYPDAQRWQELAFAVFQEFAPKQFYQDGFSKEQAISYHYYTLAFLILAIDASKKINRSVPQLEEIVDESLCTGLKFQMPNGRWPAIGDLDSARAMPVYPSDFWDFRSLHKCGRAVLDKDDGIKESAFDSPEAMTLLGKELDTSPTLLCANTLNSKTQQFKVLETLNDSGYAISRTDRDWLLFDAGPIADGVHPDSTPSTAHGHADTLQVLYHCDGINLLDDSGIPFYNGDESWIHHFRSPAAHNTIEIEGAEYVHSEGNLAWSHEVERPTLSAFTVDNMSILSGTVKWASQRVVAHRCILHLHHKGIFVADLITTESPRKITWHWQLPHDASNSTEHATVDFGKFSLTRGFGSGEHSALRRASSQSPAGWRYHEYGVGHEGSVLSHSRVIEKKALTITAIGDRSLPNIEVQCKDLTAKLHNQPFSTANGLHLQAEQINWLVDLPEKQ